MKYKENMGLSRATLPSASFFFSTLATATLLFCSSYAQNTLGNLAKGEPVTAHGTGSSGQTANSSPISLDATQFPDADMCASIADACGSGSPIPGGTTIDARGFTGDQVCLSPHATQMLSGCAANGGKLLLGTVHLYADGPTGGINGHYDDGHGRVAHSSRPLA